MRNFFVNLLFPPICDACLEESDAGFLCSSCWAQCAPPDPETRCPHCFSEWEDFGLCPECRRSPRLFFIQAFVFDSLGAARHLLKRSKRESEAVAAYALYQWSQLDWPLPDFIIPLPHPASIAIAKQLSEWLEVPYANPFRWWLRTLIDDLLPEDATLLVLDPGLPISLLERYEKEIAGACPKKCFLLSLFG